MMGYGGYGLLGGFGMGFGMIIWIVLIGLVIWAVVAVLTKSTSRSETTPLEILKQRYVRGEINKAEYDLARKDLS